MRERKKEEKKKEGGGEGVSGHSPYSQMGSVPKWNHKGININFIGPCTFSNVQLSSLPNEICDVVSPSNVRFVKTVSLTPESFMIETTVIAMDELSMMFIWNIPPPMFITSLLERTNSCPPYNLTNNNRLYVPSPK